MKHGNRTPTVQRPGLLLALCASLSLSACVTNFDETPAKKPKPATKTVQKQSTPGRYALEKDGPPLPHEIPANIGNTPDAVPKFEPKSASGNSPIYNVWGETYEVRPSAENFRERGYASWYGRKFHGHNTASGEPYDMLAMTAAHRTLPLPTYLRVTRPDTGKSIVVKVNDRGPFHSNRIIDLSYAAAAKLDMIGHGSTIVEIEAITPGQTGSPAYAQGGNAPFPLNKPAAVSAASPVPATAPAATPGKSERERGWLQVALYSSETNALSMREDLSRAGIRPVEVWSGMQGSTMLYRVLVGPYANADAALKVRERIVARGLAADWVNE